MTGRRDWFSHYKLISKGYVFIVNDRPLRIVSIGTIKLRMYDGTTCTIQNVWYVESSNKNLLSIGVLDDLKFRVEIENGIIKII